MSDINDVIRAIEELTGYTVKGHRAERRDFPDMGLDVTKRGEFFVQVVTPGYVVDATLQDGKGKTYQRRYHCNLEGSLVKEARKR